MTHSVISDEQSFDSSCFSFQGGPEWVWRRDVMRRLEPWRSEGKIGRGGGRRWRASPTPEEQLTGGIPWDSQVKTECVCPFPGGRGTAFFPPTQSLEKGQPQGGASSPAPPHTSSSRLQKGAFPVSSRIEAARILLSETSLQV